MTSIVESALQEKEARLVETLARLESVVVAYSGGVDSSLLAFYARRALGDRARIVIAVSPSIAADELDDARLQAKKFGWELSEVYTAEVENPEYQKNDGQRCYFCKGALFEALDELAKNDKIDNLAYGANMADLKDFRPGQRAAAEYRVHSPLQEAELSKEEIRELAKRAGLPSWNKPQSACLSSRFPTFEVVTPSRLKKVEFAEIALRKLGFSGFRVRFHSLTGADSTSANKPLAEPSPKSFDASAASSMQNSLHVDGFSTIGSILSAMGKSTATTTDAAEKELALARIELTPEDWQRVAQDDELRTQLVEAVKTAGFAFATLDLEGYRQGSSNIGMEDSSAAAAEVVTPVELTQRG